VQPNGALALVDSVGMELHQRCVEVGAVAPSQDDLTFAFHPGVRLQSTGTWSYTNLQHRVVTLAMKQSTKAYCLYEAGRSRNVSSSPCNSEGNEAGGCSGIATSRTRRPKQEPVLNHGTGIKPKCYGYRTEQKCGTQMQPFLARLQAQKLAES